MLVDKNKTFKLKKDEFYFVIDIISKRKDKKSKIISKFQIKKKMSTNKFNKSSFNVKLLLSKNKFTQFKTLIILIIFEDSRTS